MNRVLILLVLAGGALVGCGAPSAPEPKKDDFSLRPPPPGWKGPDGTAPSPPPQRP